jgi:hypothetical protein
LEEKAEQSNDGDFTDGVPELDADLIRVLAKRLSKDVAGGERLLGCRSPQSRPHRRALPHASSIRLRRPSMLGRVLDGSCVLVPARRAQDNPDHREHDRHFDQHHADFAQGRPPNALIPARPQGDQSRFGTVPEELLFHSQR